MGCLVAGLGATRVLHSRQFNGEAGERTSSPVHAVIHCRHTAQCVQLLLSQRSQGIMHQFTYLAGHTNSDTEICMCRSC